jgi:hypothetical protein
MDILKIAVNTFPVGSGKNIRVFDGFLNTHDASVCAGVC